MLAGLNPTEIRDIVPVIRDLCRRGITILMIEHVMQAVMSLAEHVFVLAEGRVIAQGAPAQIAQDPQVVRPISVTVPRQNGGRQMPSEALLDVRDLHAGYGETEVLRGVDLTIAPGEIVAVLGSNGVGKSTLNRALSGIVRARAGAIKFEGHDVVHEKPQAIVARGLIHVPEGRRVFPNLTVRENLDLGSYRRGTQRRAQNRDRVFSISRVCVSAARNAPALCPAASSRCWRSGAD